jgi:dTDP-4-amino-4,6-dideoxygalactose transaminase
MQGGHYAVAAANGTVTMEIGLRASNIGWGDEVILPAYTFQATAAAVMAAGAIPVIVDIDPENYCISPAAIHEAITEKTKAIIPVHLGAQMADIDQIMEIADQYNLVVIEDCAHAHGAKWQDRGAGTFGDFGSFSLQSSKILTSGEGGVLLCRSKELAARAAGILDCGRSHHPETMEETGDNFVMGTNFRMSELLCALASVGIDRFPNQVRQRENMLGYLEESLSEIDGIRLLQRDERHTIRSFYRFIFAVDPVIFGLDNYEIYPALVAEGIPCWNGYEAMNNYSLFQPLNSKLPVPSAFPAYFKYDKKDFPEATRACEHEAVWLDESIFRAGRKGIDDAVAAICKVKKNASDLRAKWNENRL